MERNCWALCHMLAREVQSTDELLSIAIFTILQCMLYIPAPGDLTIVITITEKQKKIIQLHTETHYQLLCSTAQHLGSLNMPASFLGGVYRADQKPGRLGTWAEIVFRAGQHRPFDTPLKSLHRCLSSKPTQPYSLYCIMRIDWYKGMSRKGIHAFLSMSLLQYREHKTTMYITDRCRLTAPDIPPNL